MYRSSASFSFPRFGGSKPNLNHSSSILIFIRGSLSTSTISPQSHHSSIYLSVSTKNALSSCIFCHCQSIPSKNLRLTITKNHSFRFHLHYHLNRRSNQKIQCITSRHPHSHFILLNHHVRFIHSAASHSISFLRILFYHTVVFAFNNTFFLAQVLNMMIYAFK